MVSVKDTNKRHKAEHKGLEVKLRDNSLIPPPGQSRVPWMLGTEILTVSYNIRWEIESFFVGKLYGKSGIS